MQSNINIVNSKLIAYKQQGRYFNKRNISKTSLPKHQDKYPVPLGINVKYTNKIYLNEFVFIIKCVKDMHKLKISLFASVLLQVQ